jgi:hypothetical protein
MKIKNSSALLFAFVLVQQLSADDTHERIKSVYHSGMNALMIFTSQDIMSGGTYRFDDESTLSIYGLPYIHHFDSDSSFYNYFIKFGLGYSHYKEHIDFDLFEKSDTMRMDTYAIRLGGGVRFKTEYDIDFLLSASLIYSYTNGDYKYNSKESEEILKPILDDIVNSNNDNYTYEVSIAAKYHTTIEEYSPYIAAELSYFDTKTSLDLSADLIDFSSQSSFFKLKGGVISPVLFTTFGDPTKMEGYIQQVMLSGEVVDSFELKNYTMLGTTFHIDVTGDTSYISELSIDFNIVSGANIKGMNFGLGAKF